MNVTAHLNNEGSSFRLLSTFGQDSISTRRTRADSPTSAIKKNTAEFRK